MKRGGRKTLSKKDIGDPKNFEHVSHVDQRSLCVNNVDTIEDCNNRSTPTLQQRTGAIISSAVAPPSKGAPPPPPSSKRSVSPPLPTMGAKSSTSRTAGLPPPPLVGTSLASSPSSVSSSSLQRPMGSGFSSPLTPGSSKDVESQSHFTFEQSFWQEKKPGPSSSAAGTLVPGKSGTASLRRSKSFPSFSQKKSSIPHSRSLSRNATTERGLSKADVGPPVNFQHVGHIGLGSQGAICVNAREIDEPFLSMIQTMGGSGFSSPLTPGSSKDFWTFGQSFWQEKKPCPSSSAAGTTVPGKSGTTSLKRSKSFPSFSQKKSSIPHSRSFSRNATTERRLSKAEIGCPGNFRHVAHIEWDSQGGINVNNVDIDTNLKTQGGVETATKRKIGQSRESKVPLEIRCRGPEAERAYRQALKKGKVEVYQARIMLIGQDRAGKTSLKKSLTGLSFDPEEQSTDGIVVDPSRFSVDVVDAVDWQISKTSDVKKNQFEDGVVSVMAELLNPSQKAQEPESTDSSHSQLSQNQQIFDVGPHFNQEIKKEKKKEKAANIGPKLNVVEKPSATDVTESISEDDIRRHLQVDVSTSNHQIDHVKNSHDNSKKSKEKSKEEDNETGNAARKDVPETVIENLIQRLSAKNLGSSAGQETTVSIWDFAGQQLYYASHPVFFSPRAVYVLVYSLEKDLVAEAEPCVKQGVNEIRLDNHDHQTNLDALLSWLVSIHNARPKASDEGKRREELPYLRPPVIIVGTHADCPFEEPKKMEEIIQKSLTMKSYDQHVTRPFITVNNTLSSNDDGVKKLKEKVKELFSMEPYMGEKVPVRWFKFEQVIKSLVEEEGKNHMSMKDLESLIEKVCDIKDKKEILALLNFYHDLGVIVKHGKTVVLQAEWLIDLFRKLITVRRFNDQNPVNSRHWSILEETGILNMELVENVFKDKIERGETKDDILAMMEQYGLIARFGGNEDPKNFQYFVPAQLKSSPKEFLDVGPSKSDPCTLYLHFLDGFIPHGLYDCLVSRMIAWCSEKGYPHKPNLYQSVSKFFIGCTYRYELFLIRRKRFVKVVLRSLQAERAWVFQPVAFQIRESLERSLKDIREECFWYQSLNYDICVRCPSRHREKCKGHQLESCIDDDCLHLLTIEGGRELVCRESIGEESKPYILGLEEWYREHLMVPVQNKAKDPTVNTTFDLNNEQKRWMVVGICLNKILLPTLRRFIKPNMLRLYSDLKTNRNIDTQARPGHLTSDGRCNSLNYGSINSNQANHRNRAQSYDYSVSSAVDLAKLYLQPFMAQFSGFDDTCDLSAALGILSSASVFSTGVQDKSIQVKNDVRNEWSHCNFSVWDDAKFKTCFTLMNSLVKELSLTPEEEKRVSDELREWEDKGVQLCMGQITDTDLVKFVEFAMQYLID